MTGKDFKNVLIKSGMTMTDIAGKLGISTQALNSIFNGSDVRSGIIEKCVDKLGMSYSDFYHGMAYMHDNYGAAFGGQVETINNSDCKDIGLVYRSSKQLTKAQEQIDRLLGIIERMTNKDK